MTKPKTCARKRMGRCYELAFKSLLDMKDPGDWRLVHGEVDCYDPASDSPRIINFVHLLHYCLFNPGISMADIHVHQL